MSRSEKFRNIRDIADAIGTKSATAEQIAELEQLLTGNIEAQRFYYDYMGMHMHLLAAADRNMEFVYRRMTSVTEEFVVRNKNGEHISHDTNTYDGANQQKTLPHAEHLVNPLKNKPTASKLKWGILITSLLVLLLLLIWSLFNRSSTELKPFIAEIVQGHVSIIEQGEIDGNYLLPGQYQVAQDSLLKLPSGETLHLSSHAIFKLFNSHEIQLKSGMLKLDLMPEHMSGQNIIVHGPSFSLFSNGGALALDLSQTNPIITSGNNTLLSPKRWRPNNFWSFDGQGKVALDSAGNLHGKKYANATRISGLIGSGAFSFNNDETSLIRIESGGGTVLGTGSFSVIDGVTIEALIRPNYSGEVGEIDGIFRKGWHDKVDLDSKELRMVLNFLNDQGNVTLRPEGDFKESLSFGLFIVGQGYHQLRLPLDGLDGRPTLAQLKNGNIYHIVASYNVQTGLKAIYIDGVKQAFYQYPPGSKMLSGGIGRAAIGNTPASARRGKEAFSGDIDEVAFYNFALPELMIKNHFEHTQQGRNYFGFPPSVTPLPQQAKLPLQSFSAITLDPLSGLPIQVISQANN
ncbi:MAG: LamG-like jellyroll fold domain-containing protein [Thalassotalea sp.]